MKSIKTRDCFIILQLSIANKLIFSKWREALGNKVKCIVYWWRSLPGKIDKNFYSREDFDDGRLWPNRNIAGDKCKPVSGRWKDVWNCGPLIRNVEVKIAEDGEILCKGPNIMMGYYKRPELTAEAMEDGWFNTGDIGMMIDNKFLKITDRKKEMFKTSGGKYVAPLLLKTN